MNKFEGLFKSEEKRKKTDFENSFEALAKMEGSGNDLCVTYKGQNEYCSPVLVYDNKLDEFRGYDDIKIYHSKTRETFSLADLLKEKFNSKQYFLRG